MTGTKNTPKIVLFTCGKCDGRGRLNWTNRDGGICYWCEGAGKCSAQAPDVIKQAISLANDAANTAAVGIISGNEDYARHYANDCARELCKLGTEKAREVLNTLWARGEVFECYDFPRANAYGRIKLTDAEKRELRALIIEEGRKLKAAA